MKPWLPFSVFVTLTCLAYFPGRTEPVESANQLNPGEEDHEECVRNLKSIYGAIQAYRKDHKELPNWLSDLVTNYLSDPAVLSCPVTKRTGLRQAYERLADPKIAGTYIYQFSQAEMGALESGGGKTKMQDWKRQQMAMVGGGVPILTCVLHLRGLLHISFDGAIFESRGDWEGRFAEVVEGNKLTTSPLAAAKKLEGQTPDEAPSPLLGKRAPDFKLELLEGGELELASHLNKEIVILDFWASWSGWCRAALPAVTRLAQDYKNKGLAYYGVNLHEAPKKIQDFLSETGLKFAVALDNDGAVGKLYEVTDIPTLVIVGKDGRVQDVHVRYSPDFKQVLKEKLETLLAGDNLPIQKTAK